MHCTVVCVLIVLLIIVLLLQLLSIGLKVAQFVNPNEVLSEELTITSEEIAIQNGKIAALQDMIRQVSGNISIEEELRIAKEEITIQTDRKISALENDINQAFAEVTENTQLIQELGLFISDNNLKKLCNISSFNWRRVAYINMTDPEAECPSGLNETSNSTTGQRACGRGVDGEGRALAHPRGCSSVTFPVNTTYSHVCGYARGYQYYTMDAFWTSPIRTINDAYIDGLSITHGNPRKHLWTLAVGNPELFSTIELKCPRDGDPFDFTRVSDFVNNDFYCESGFIGPDWEERIAWEDPLWDGQQCVSSTAQSCSRYGWFHRDITASQEDIEVRWCADQSRSDEDFYTDLLEIWVL